MENDKDEVINLSSAIKKRKRKNSRAKRIVLDDSMGVSRKDINYLKGQIRLAFTRSDYKASYLASKKLSKPRYKVDDTRHKVDSVMYRCEACEELFNSSRIEVDHILEVSDYSEINIDNIGEWIKRLYCSWSNLQVLCKVCHLDKTKKHTRSV